MRKLTAGQTLTVDDLAYVAQLEATACRLHDLVDVDLAGDLARERNRTHELRRTIASLKAELVHAGKVNRWLRHRNRRLLALLRTLHPRKETTSA